MPPAFLRGFGKTPQSNTPQKNLRFCSSQSSSTATFGSEMGLINGTDWGRLLMRGSYNAQPWGPLYPIQVDGVNAGTDLYFNKSQSVPRHVVTGKLTQ
jgi:hypothetical protein